MLRRTGSLSQSGCPIIVTVNGNPLLTTGRGWEGRGGEGRGVEGRGVKGRGVEGRGVEGTEGTKMSSNGHYGAVCG